MLEQPFYIPDDFRAFMQRVVAFIDTPGDDKFLDAEDALQDTTGYGGRIDRDTYRFTYITADGLYKWELPLREAAVRDVADGLLVEIMGTRLEIVRSRERSPQGEPLLWWGEYREDALQITSTDQYLAAVDSLQTASYDAARMLRVWTAFEDQCVAVIKGDACALYVIESVDGYGSSLGDPARTDAFEVIDHDGKPLSVPWSDCISWGIARPALMSFLQTGDLGIPLEGRIPSSLLMMGDIDRKAAIAMRGAPPTELKRSSLPRMSTPIPVEVMTVDEKTTPVELDTPMTPERLAAWAKRLIEVLFSRSLIELGTGNLEEITYQLGGLLQAHAAEAEHSLDTAEWLANEIGAIRGIAKLFATGGDLQIAMRRSRDP
jgi:hypothetical protein